MLRLLKALANRRPLLLGVGVALVAVIAFALGQWSAGREPAPTPAGAAPAITPTAALTTASAAPAQVSPIAAAPAKATPPSAPAATAQPTPAAGGPAPNLIAPNGAKQVVTIAVPGQNPALRFEGRPGQRVSVQASEGAFSSPTIIPGTIALYAPSGKKLAEGRITNNAALIEPVILPEAGTFTIAVDLDGDRTGRLSLALYDAPDSIGQILPDGSKRIVDIAVPGQNPEYHFVGRAGQQVSVRASEGTFPPDVITPGAISLYAPSGKKVADKRIANNAAFIEPVTLQEEGIFRLVIDLDGARTGRIALALYEVP